jgi:hypothetical protein
LKSQWFFGGQPLSNATNMTFVVSDLQPPKAGPYAIMISNLFGVAWSTSSVMLSSIPLADALDTPGWVWERSGDVIEFASTNDSVQGGSSLQWSWQSDYDGRTKFSSLTTQIEGPGTLSFWWRHAAQPQWYLTSLSFAGVSSRSIEPNTDWRRETIYLPAGSRMLEWNYYAYTYPPSRVQSAWLDGVHFEPGATVPFFLQQPTPASLVVLPKLDVSFSASIDGTPPLDYRWRHNGTNLPGASSPFLSLSAISVQQAGVYDLLVTNSAGSVTSAPVTINVLTAPSNVVVAITDYPPNVGDVGWVSGTVSMQGSHLSNYVIVSYIKVGYGGYWVKPYFASPLTSISSDDGAHGTFALWPFTGGIDALCFRITCFVIPRGWSPPLLAGSSTLPESLFTHSEAHHEILRGLTVQPRIQIATLASEEMRLSLIEGQNWLYYAVQATDSLTTPDWVTLPGSTNLFYGPYTFDDHIPAGAEQKFYRLEFVR